MNGDDFLNTNTTGRHFADSEGLAQATIFNGNNYTLKNLSSLFTRLYHFLMDANGITHADGFVLVLKEE